MSKQHVTLAVCGHLDAGKSTTIGHLIFKQGGILPEEMEKARARTDESGMYSFVYAYLLDNEKEERAKGLTIQCNTKELFTERYHYTVVDAPGHRDYINNMITGCSTADVGLLLVPADNFQTAIAQADPKLGVEEGQTSQHARLLYLLGVDQLIVGINKMDAWNWEEARFNEIKGFMTKMLQGIGFRRTNKIPFIPFSGFGGDNLVAPSDKCPWYKGWRAMVKPEVFVEGVTLLDALDKFIQPPERSRYPNAPVRLPVSAVYNIKGVGKIICGTVEQGTLRPGDMIGFACSGFEYKEVLSIEQHHQVLESAGPGDSVGLSIKGITEDEKVEPGDVIYKMNEGTLKPIKKFHAMVMVQEIPRDLKVGYAPLIFCRTARVACKMVAINWKMSKATGREKIENPPHLSQFETAEVVFEPQQPLFVEEFAKCQNLGRIAVMDSDDLKMIGKVTAVES